MWLIPGVARDKRRISSTVWEVSSGFPSLSAHVLVHPGDDCHEIRRELADTLAREFGIEHTTLQVDHSAAGRLLTVDQASN